MSLEPTKLPPNQQVDLGHIAPDSGLTQIFFREGLRQAPTKFIGAAVERFRCVVEEVETDGSLRIGLRERAGLPSSHDIWVGLSDRRIGREPISPRQQLELARVSLDRLEMRHDGNVPSDIEVECCSVNPDRPLVFDDETYSEFVSLPGRVRLLGALEDGAQQFFVDIRVFNTCYGSVALSAMRRDRDDGTSRPALNARDVNIYALDIHSRDLEHQGKFYVLANPRVLDQIFMHAVEAMLSGGVVEAIKSAQDLLRNVLETPNALAGEPVTVMPDPRPLSTSFPTAPINDDKSIADLEKVWREDGTYSCFGFYPCDDFGSYRFLDVFRHTQGADRIMFIGTRKTGELVEAPPNSSRDVVQYRCVINGELMPLSLNLSVGAGHKSDPRTRIEERFLFSVRLFNEKGIDAVKTLFQER